MTNPSKAIDLVPIEDLCINVMNLKYFHLWYRNFKLLKNLVEIMQALNLDLVHHAASIDLKALFSDHQSSLQESLLR